jgi:hypothetical protein
MGYSRFFNSNEGLVSEHGYRVVYEAPIDGGLQVLWLLCLVSSRRHGGHRGSDGR